MNRMRLRTKYVGAEPTLRGQRGWAHRPANATGEAWEFHSDDGTQTPCNTQDVTVWLGGSNALTTA
jgi:hypothetical protein